MSNQYAAATLGTQAEVASGNLTLTEPAGSASGDLLVALITVRGSAAFTKPALWGDAAPSLLGDANLNGIGGLRMDFIIRGGSAPALTWTRTGGDVARGLILRYPGPWAASPLDVNGSAQAGASGTTVSLSSLTPNFDSCLMVEMFGGGNSVGQTELASASHPTTAQGSTTDTGTPPMSDRWLRRVATGTTTGADTNIGVADAVMDKATATGTITATSTGTAARHTIAVAFFKNANVDNTREEVSKIRTYAVMRATLDAFAVSRVRAYAVMMPTAPDSIAVSRLRAYSVLVPPMAVSKFQAYAVMGPLDDREYVSKFQGYAVMGPLDDREYVSKVQAYAVMGPDPASVKVSKFQAYAVMKANTSARRRTSVIIN